MNQDMEDNISYDRYQDNYSVDRYTYHHESQMSNAIIKSKNKKYKAKQEIDKNRSQKSTITMASTKSGVWGNSWNIF